MSLNIDAWYANSQNQLATLILPSQSVNRGMVSTVKLELYQDTMKKLKCIEPGQQKCNDDEIFDKWKTARITDIECQELLKAYLEVGTESSSNIEINNGKIKFIENKLKNLRESENRKANFFYHHYIFRNCTFCTE